jgi:hypothetical protein
MASRPDCSPSRVIVPLSLGLAYEENPTIGLLLRAPQSW